MDIDPEQRRRINANLIALRNGTVRREQEAESDRKKAKRQAVKVAKRDLRRILKRIEAVQEEVEWLQQHLDKMLATEETHPGGIDECDHAIEGCQNELHDLNQEADGLRRMIEN